MKMGELGQPVLQPLQCSLSQWTQIRSRITGMRVVPLAQFSNQLKQPCQSIGTFETRAFLASEVYLFVRDVLCGQALPQGFSGRGQQ
jgi:hypothetical protein